MNKQNNIKGSMLIDYANLLRNTIEELHDWEQETERCAIVAAVDHRPYLRRRILKIIKEQHLKR